MFDLESLRARSVDLRMSNLMCFNEASLLWNFVFPLLISYSMADSRVAHVQNLLLTAASVVYLAGATVILYSSPEYWRQPYHTSALSGSDWVNELVHGHPDRIYSELGIRLHVFTALVEKLHFCGMHHSRHLRLDEQVAIFLYMAVTGLSVRHTGERFQRSNETIAKLVTFFLFVSVIQQHIRYFRLVLETLASHPFYTELVSIPEETSGTPLKIMGNPKWFPFFKDALGAMDGTHIACCPSAEDRAAARNRKGGVSQNCLACCTIDDKPRFLYIVSGHEGSVTDAYMYSEARFSTLRVPEGKFYLADGGFGTCDALLVPYRGVRYHLAEWGRANVRYRILSCCSFSMTNCLYRPVTKEELFNLRHASARNPVERIFGIIKKRWAILTRPPQYDMDTQARILPALAALHNFILDHDNEDLEEYRHVSDDQRGTYPDPSLFGTLATEIVDRAEQIRADARRDRIAQEMWDEYLTLLELRGDIEE